MGRVTGRNAAKFAGQRDYFKKTELLVREELNFFKSAFGRGCDDIKQLTSSLKQLVWENAGIIRSRDSLEHALSSLETIESDLPKASINKAWELMRYIELRNMLAVSKIVCHFALLRQESRGSHYRSDFPVEDNQNWLKNIIVWKENDNLKTEAIPIDQEVLRKLNIDVNSL